MNVHANVVRWIANQIVLFGWSLLFILRFLSVPLSLFRPSFTLCLPLLLHFTFISSVSLFLSLALPRISSSYHIRWSPPAPNISGVLLLPPLPYLDTVARFFVRLNRILFTPCTSCISLHCRSHAHTRFNRALPHLLMRPDKIEYRTTLHFLNTFFVRCLSIYNFLFILWMLSPSLMQTIKIY